MTTVREIESAIEKLQPSELSQLSQWFEDYLEKLWDARIEADANAGKFARFKDEISLARAGGELIDYLKPRPDKSVNNLKK